MARPPSAILSTRNENALGSGRGVLIVTTPFASTMAGHAVAHSKPTATQWQPASQRADHPLEVVSTTMLKELAGWLTTEPPPIGTLPIRRVNPAKIARIFSLWSIREVC
jgi:hypothetical protein